MVELFARDLDIAGAEAVDLVGEGALQHQCQFRAAVAVVGDGGAGGDEEEAGRGLARGGQDRLFHAHADGFPFDRVEVAADIVLHRARQRAGGPLGRLGRGEVGGVDQGQGVLERGVGQGGIAAILHQGAADRVEGRKTGAAFVAHGDMRGHRETERLGQGARGIAHEQLVTQVVFDRVCHRRHHFIWWRRRSSASLILDLMVPSGRPVSSAISEWVRSPK